jgi:hypothetical protein
MKTTQIRGPELNIKTSFLPVPHPNHPEPRLIFPTLQMR